MAGKNDTLDLIDKTPSGGGWWKWISLVAVIVAVGGILLWWSTRGPEETAVSRVQSTKTEEGTKDNSPQPPDSSMEPEKSAEEAKTSEPATSKGNYPVPAESDSARPIVLKTSEVVYFATGSSSLTAGEQAKLNSFASTLKNKTGNLLIDGHADAIGTDEFNEMLSKQRADRVLSFLRSAGLDGGWKVDLNSYGEQKPASDNDTPEGRSKNRRVELATN